MLLKFGGMFTNNFIGNLPL